MAFDYSGLIQTARTLIAEFGGSGVAVVPSSMPLDASKPFDGQDAAGDTEVSVSAVEAEVSGVVEPGSRLYRYQLVLLVAPPATGEDLALATEFRIGSKHYRVTSPEIIRPNGTDVVLYIYGVQR